MPLPFDDKIVKLANGLLPQPDAIFGLHPGFRAAHTKGIMLTCTFNGRCVTSCVTWMG